jgi:hypothetical protein
MSLPEPYPELEEVLTSIGEAGQLSELAAGLDALESGEVARTVILFE